MDAGSDQDGFSTHRSLGNSRVGGGAKFRKGNANASKKLPPMQFGSNNTRITSRTHEPKVKAQITFTAKCPHARKHEY